MNNGQTTYKHRTLINSLQQLAQRANLLPKVTSLGSQSIKSSNQFMKPNNTSETIGLKWSGLG